MAVFRFLLHLPLTFMVQNGIPPGDNKYGPKDPLTAAFGPIQFVPEKSLTDRLPVFIYLVEDFTAIGSDKN